MKRPKKYDFNGKTGSTKEDMKMREKIIHTLLQNLPRPTLENIQHHYPVSQPKIKYCLDKMRKKGLATEKEGHYTLKEEPQKTEERQKNCEDCEYRKALKKVHNTYHKVEPDYEVLN